MTTTDAPLAYPQRVPLRHLVSFNPRPRVFGTDLSCYLPMEAIAEFGNIDTSRYRPTSELQQGYSYLEDGDVAYAKVTPCFENGKGLLATALPDGHAFATTEVTVLRPRPRLDARYLSWVLQSDDFRSPGEAQMSGAGGLKRVPESYAAGYKIALPTLDRQRAIADYLDRETAQIDAFIAKNEELVALLTERRAAVLDRTMSAFSSSLRRLKYRLKANTGGVWGEDPSGVNDSVVLRSTEQTIDGQWRIDTPAKRSLTPAEARRYLLREGDLVITKSSGSESHIGKASVVDSEVAGLKPAYSNFMQRITPTDQLNSNFLWYAMRTKPVRDQLALMSTSTTGLGNLTGTIIGNLLVPSPSIETQIATVEELDHVSRITKSAISSAQRALVLARERRAALISAAVMGKIDVEGKT